MPSFASGKSSRTAAAIMCAALWRIAARWSVGAGAISSASIAIVRSVARQRSDALELLEGLPAIGAVIDRPAERRAEGILERRVPRSAVGTLGHREDGELLELARAREGCRADM